MTKMGRVFLCGMIAMLAAAGSPADIGGQGRAEFDTWQVAGNGHDATHWRNNLWLFSQRVFKS